MEIYTDASGTGWGAINGFDNIYGFWEDNQKEFHINYKELLVVKLALESLANHLSNCQLLLRIDNTTAISYVSVGHIGPPGSTVSMMPTIAARKGSWKPMVTGARHG